MTDSFSEELGAFAGGTPRLRAPPGAHRPSPHRRLHGRKAARRDRPTPPSCSTPATMPTSPSATPRRCGSLQGRPAAGLRRRLGHRKILYAPPVVRAATTYILRQRAHPLSPCSFSMGRGWVRGCHTQRCWRMPPPLTPTLSASRRGRYESRTRGVELLDRVGVELEARGGDRGPRAGPGWWRWRSAR